MFNKDEKTIYYISNLGTDKVSIIDGNSYSLIKDIEIGPRPQEIIVDEENNIYIASDRNGKITCIDDVYDVSKIWYMPNNGKIRVDLKAQKIYVCNTEEVCIYSLKTGEKIKILKDFFVADGLDLDKDKKKLFVLDIFQKEIKVYNTLNFTLISNYKNIGSSPKDMIIDENRGYIYISNKDNNGVNISILNIENGQVSKIDFEKESNITSFDQDEGFLYVANKGLNRIEVIDIVRRKSIANIKTTLQEVQKLKITEDKKILLATSTSKDGKAVIDRIDVTKNTIIDTFEFEGENNLPCDIGIVNQNKIKVNDENLIFKGKEEKANQEKGVSLLAKKIISTYQEKLTFSEVLVEVSKINEEIIEVEEITFEKCEVLEESKDRKLIDNREKYSILSYDFNIPYYVKIKSNTNERYLIKGKIKGSQRARLYIPEDIEEKGFEILITSLSKVTSTPLIIDKSIKFDISTLISTKIIVEEEVFIPFCKCYERGE